jgi:hypothetical protein
MLGGLLLTGSMMAFAGRYGKAMLASFGERYAGAQGASVIKNVFKATGNPLVNFLPVAGPLNILRNEVKSGWQNIKDIGVYRSQWQHAEGRLASAIKDVRHVRFMGDLDPVVRTKARHAHFQFIKSLRANPGKYKEGMQGAWTQTMEGFGIHGNSMHGRVIDSLTRVRDTADHAQMASRVYGTSMVSNMAAIAMPTLGSSVAAYTITKAVYNRSKKRLQGYESIY